MERAVAACNLLEQITEINQNKNIRIHNTVALFRFNATQRYRDGGGQKHVSAVLQDEKRSSDSKLNLS